MKKLFPILLALALLSTACQLGGGQAQPTAIALPTSAPTLTPVALNPTAEAAGGNMEAGSERVSPGDGMIQIYIPQGSFQMGGLDARADADEKPVHKVDMKGYWIDKVEVTNAMYLLCVQAGVCSPPQSVASETRPSYFNNPEYNNFPVVNVSWDAARQYCEWAGRRLPTEAEWEYAARGSTINTYPWGEQKPDATRANFNYMLGDTNQVGSYSAGASPFGVLDMAGNVFEWTKDFYDAQYYASGPASNPAGPLARSTYFNRVVRGGSFADGEAEIRASNRASVLGPNFNAELGSAAYLGDFSSRIGFRCAAD
jgi:formylglycine-generating enzyme required for sulfatase activity